MGEPTLRDLGSKINTLQRDMDIKIHRLDAMLHHRDDQHNEFEAGVNNQLAKLESQNNELSKQLARVLDHLQVVFPFSFILMIDLTALLPTAPQPPTSPSSLNAALTSSSPIKNLALPPPPPFFSTLTTPASTRLLTVASIPATLAPPLSSSLATRWARTIPSASSSTSLSTPSPSLSSDDNTPSSQPYAW
ncbi:hypothetical protein L873DRAFT_1794329 [Choiromyces venosus 120613-1]|uniref:Uncharacterized protein n=1 Tax=Choiromyces venosus 120613-1 TaxID=1336337 RepID=A0A3N4J1R9_9PEZI|nr:hypothetical protein L873DRAFT_1794329 [Choiromyces venosus 120613-1]